MSEKKEKMRELKKQQKLLKEFLHILNNNKTKKDWA